MRGENYFLHTKVGAFLFAIAALLSASVNAENAIGPLQNPISLWCAANEVGDGGPNDWIRLSEQAIHVVRASMQQHAQAALSKDVYVRLRGMDATPYLRDGEKASQDKFLYLVRAGAFYVSDKYDLPKPAYRELPFDVSYSPSRDKLTIVNFALGAAGIAPTNLALVVEAPNVVERSDAVCLRTQ